MRAIPLYRHSAHIFIFLMTSGFSMYFSATLRTGNDNLSLTHRDTADGLTVLAGKILVCPICVTGTGTAVSSLDILKKCQKFSILLPSLIQIFRKHSEERPDPQDYGPPIQNRTGHDRRPQCKPGYNIQDRKSVV